VRSRLRFLVAVAATLEDGDGFLEQGHRFCLPTGLDQNRADVGAGAGFAAAVAAFAEDRGRFLLRTHGFVRTSGDPEEAAQGFEGEGV
jgi:hypothetical protein